MITTETRTVFHCRCERPDCRHEWDAFVKPKRCAGCKYRSWNKEDYRRKDPFEFAPPAAEIKVGQAPPKLRPKEMLETFNRSKAILEKLIEDNPCEHPDSCVCSEKEVLALLNKQIEALAKFSANSTRRQRRRAAVAKAG